MNNPSPLRLLVVEDNTDDVVSIERLFRKKNLSVEITHCLRGEDVLALLQRDSGFDAIITDYCLPGISGIELSKQLLAMNLNCPVVMLTGRGNEMAAVEAMKAGISDYVVKGSAQDNFNFLPEMVLHAIEKKREQERLHAYENQLRKLSQAVEQSASAILITNPEGVIEYVNPRFSEMTGYALEEAVGFTPALLKSGNTPNQVYEHLWETILAGRDWKSELQNRTKTGQLYWARTSISPVKNADGRVTHFIEIQEDITETRALTEQLSYQASHDVMTGLINRGEFEKRLLALIKGTRQHDAEHTLCYIDLDQFKVVNDTCGHAAGDALLQQMADVLRKLVRKRDIVARLGGDEFGILMESCPLEQAERIISEQHQHIREFRFSWEDKIFTVGASIGLVSITSGSGSLSDLLRQADAACYAAKDRGRNCIHVYKPDDEELVRRHGEMQWVTRITEALDKNLFRLYGQSIVPLGDDAHAPGQHCEILLRMVDGERIVPPGAFLPAAERYHLSTHIDRWVIKTLFEHLVDFPQHLDNLNLCAINISGHSLVNDELLEFIIEQFHRATVPPEKICFEITETAAISNLAHASRFIASLGQLGCRFALDDFGSGFSSFGYLKRLPVNYLKIDGVFVQGMAKDPIDQAMVKSINDIGHVLGKITIAEFVDNQDIAVKLKQIGVDYVQGYFLGKPMPLAELLGEGLD
ncbi:MAG TPA: EAL domain-containing protein [Methylococcaceae bacterium]|nr:EAL domain-containing protein [Methylococcaceae bacterium]